VRAAVLALACALVACVAGPEPAARRAAGGAGPVAGPSEAPRPRVETTVTEVFGEELRDDYAWMERGEAELAAHRRAEERWARAVLAPLAGLREELRREMLRNSPASATPPVRVDDWLYFSRSPAGEFQSPAGEFRSPDGAVWSSPEGQRSVHLRRRATAESREEVILDVAALAAGREGFRFEGHAVSPDHRHVAYLFRSGGTATILAIKDLTTGELLPEGVRGAGSVVWGSDGETLVYTVVDEAFSRARRAYRHRLGTRVAADELLYAERDPAFSLRVEATRSGRFILLVSDGPRATEVRVLDAEDGAAAPRLFAPRREGLRYALAHQGDHFLVLAREEGVGTRLLAAPLAGGAPADWPVVLPARAGVELTAIEPFARHWVAVERVGGVPRLRVRDLARRNEHTVRFPEEVYTLAPEANPTFEATTFRFAYSSLVTPWTVYDYDLEARTSEVLGQRSVPGYDPRRYVVARVEARAEDGTAVPVSLVHRRGVEKGGRNPCLLVAYGAYGETIEPAFSAERLSLLDRGVVYAIAHVRGGGFLGEDWHRRGRGAAKAMSVGDFLAAAERLIAEGYSAPDGLVIAARGAGGLLVGAALNRRPDLFAAAVAEDPFVDPLGTLLERDAEGPAADLAEWGDPNDEAGFRALLAISPYQNVAPGPYPPLLVTSASTDASGPPAAAARWVARLRAATTADGPPLLLPAGPGAEEDEVPFGKRALLYAFLLDAVGWRGGGSSGVD
jgi:oligopeptidase B